MLAIFPIYSVKLEHLNLPIFFPGLVTAAMKLKRKEIENRFCNQLDIMYSGATSTNLNKITKDQPVKMSQIAPA